MSKIKKIFIGLGVFIVASFTKVGEVISKVTALEDISSTQMLYGPPPSSTGESISKIAKPIILVVAFVIGLFVILSKKITKKVKVIVVFVLIILIVLGYVLMNYIVT